MPNLACCKFMEKLHNNCRHKNIRSKSNTISQVQTSLNFLSGKVFGKAGSSYF